MSDALRTFNVLYFFIYNVNDNKTFFLINRPLIFTSKAYVSKKGKRFFAAFFKCTPGFARHFTCKEHLTAHTPYTVSPHRSATVEFSDAHTPYRCAHRTGEKMQPTPAVPSGIKVHSNRFAAGYWGEEQRAFQIFD